MADETQNENPNDDQNGDDSALTERVRYLRELAQIVSDEGLSRLKVEGDDFKITLKSAVHVTYSAPQITNASGAFAPIYQPASAAPENKSANAEEKLIPVVSPMVGVFYRAPSPNDSNFIEVGDRVERGQTIGLVEAMKVFNEITAENAGVVSVIKAQTGQLVETGEALLLLK